ncbi:hypothetical protein ANAEL_00715 [Anaerolineales bacterium]|nr:hypothetical protein ANAEL_00715 [Anaerolineales bacterium]
MSISPLEHAVALIKRGELVEAQKVLDQIIQADPHNLEAWFWFVETCPTNKQRIQVLEICLESNPDNTLVIQLLDKLRSQPTQEDNTVGTLNRKRLRLKPGDKVRVREDVGEFYADFPDYTILRGTKGSVGTIVSFEEFQADLEERRQRFGHEDRQKYRMHIFVVREAMNQCLQYPVRFEKVFPPAERADLLCSQVGRIELMDVTALEKLGGGQPEYINVKNADSQLIVKNAYAYQPPQAFHDEHKLNDLVLALALAHGGPPSPEDNEIIYLRHTSLLATHALWYRLKMSVDEEALNIILMLRDTTSRHQGLEWEEIERLIEVNVPKKPLWYTLQQKETLLKWVNRIREDEKKKSFQQTSREGNPEIRNRVEGSFLGRIFKKK